MGIQFVVECGSRAPNALLASKVVMYSMLAKSYKPSKSFPRWSWTESDISYLLSRAGVLLDGLDCWL